MSKKHTKIYTDEEMRRGMELIPWEKAKARWMKDPSTKKAYDELRPQFKIIETIIKARIREEMTQRELSKKAGIAQSQLARLESGRTNPTVAFLDNLLKHLGLRVEVVKA